jgi:hypothetical protein
VFPDEFFLDAIKERPAREKAALDYARQILAKLSAEERQILCAELSVSPL